MLYSGLLTETAWNSDDTDVWLHCWMFLLSVATTLWWFYKHWFLLEVRDSTLERLYSCSNLVRYWQYKKKDGTGGYRHECNVSKKPKHINSAFELYDKTYFCRTFMSEQDAMQSSCSRAFSLASFPCNMTKVHMTAERLLPTKSVPSSVRRLLVRSLGYVPPHKPRDSCDLSRLSM